jgi:uncharacterized protein YcnI
VRQHARSHAHAHGYARARTRDRGTTPAMLVGLATLLALSAVALPASAHPFVRGGEVPVDSVATVTLAMAHGCGTEDSGGGDPTLEIALEVPDQVRIVAIADDPSYAYELEAGADGRIEVIEWTATGDGEPAPDVEFDAVFSGEVGDEVHLKVFQGCEGFAYRWVGTPDEPADDPAVRVTLVDADADAPPPGDDEVTPAEVEAAPTDTDTATDAADADDGGDPDAAEAEEGADGDGADDLASDTDAELDGTDEAAADGGPVVPILLIVVVVGLAGVAIVVARRSRTGGDGADAAP